MGPEHAVHVDGSFGKIGHHLRVAPAKHPWREQWPDTTRHFRVGVALGGRARHEYVIVPPTSGRAAPPPPVRSGARVVKEGGGRRGVKLMNPGADSDDCGD